MQHKGTKVLETNRLILRPFTVADAAAMYRNWASEDKVTKYLMWPTHKDVSVSESVLKDWTAHYSESNYYLWAIVLKEIDEPIGSIAVVGEIDETIEKGHIGYCIGSKWWHLGITSEAMREVIRFLFEEVGMNRIECRHDPRNENSGAVMRKCGLTFEGTLRKADWNNQGVCDASYYSILKEEFDKIHS